MKIILYNNKSENNKITKDIEKVEEIEGTLKDETSFLSPVFMIKKNELPIFNYCEIPDFKRFYFLNSISSVRNGLWEITFNTDVLMSYKDEIKKQKAIFDKQELQQYSNNFLDDGSFIVENREYIEVKEFANGFEENGEFVLITAGGIKNNG